MLNVHSKELGSCQKKILHVPRSYILMGALIANECSIALARLFIFLWH